jgi:protein-tyrosine-phosphatase
VLLVCDGNICRSPMASAYLKARAAHAGLAHVVIDSAGLLGIEGAPAAAHAIEVGRKEGFDLTRHRSRGITPADVRAADLVLVMTLAHLEELAQRFPDKTQKRLLLRAFEAGPEPKGGAPELSDPVSGPYEGFRDAFSVIRTCVDHLVLWLRHAA